MASGETYEEFVEKFKPKKTTDDCYTPPLVYDAVANWVANEYGISREKFVRPFFPGGDYENYDYSGGAIVVDNPPFSIFSKILDFYISNNIKFFLFANNLTLFTSVRDRNCTAMIVDTNVIYENGANVKTSFVTNLESRDLRFRVAPSLHQAVKNAVDLTRKQVAKSPPKYSYPSNVAQAARLGPFARYGIEIRVKKSESTFISRLDSQKSTKKAIFGGAYLVFEECAKKYEKAEREKAEREKAERFTLSEREKEIIKTLGEN